MMKKPAPEIAELSMDDLEELLKRAQPVLDEKTYRILDLVVRSHVYLTGILRDREMSLQELRRLLFGPQDERTGTLFPDEKPEAEPSTEPHNEASPEAAPAADPAKPERKPAAGHGRNGADAYPGGEQVDVRHPSLKSQDPCPECKKGKLHEQSRPAVIVRITGQTPLHAKVYRLQRLRCNLCGKVFTAAAPEGLESEKYDPRSASMIALLRYGSGLPFNRLEGLQEDLGVPLPASTQWDVVHRTARRITPAYEELVRQAAQGEVLHNDDTGMKILERMGKRLRSQGCAQDDSTSGEAAPQRKGIFTSGVVSTSQGRRIALFMTGHQHAGENLTDVLARRAAELAPPIQMCDALSRNLPRELEVLLANCLAHGRRKFVEVAAHFPQECRYVLETLGAVYRNDEITRRQQMLPEERLRFHQKNSGPLMEGEDGQGGLKEWLTRQIENHQVEPNSGLGQAIAYMLKHWPALTLFLRQPGAPLDNNLCERALKKAILHRKNSLFYKTLKGARVGDLFMSLIHTCQLNGASAFHYLTELARHAGEVAQQPQAWMPWNYREALASATSPPDTDS